MISKIELEKDYFSGDVIAFTIENVNVTNLNQKVKLYIPTLMSGIKKGAPMKSTLNSKGKSVFANAKKCRPYIHRTVMKDQNYLEGRLELSDDLGVVVTNVYNDKGEITNKYIKAGTKVRCYFLNGKVSKLYFCSDEER